MQKIAKPTIRKVLEIEKSSNRPWFKFSVLMTALSLMIFASAKPQFVSETKIGVNSRNEIIIAMDISNSMLASLDNSNFSRLDMAKNAVYKLIDELNGEKLGLILFAGKAVIQVPITQDYSAFRVILKSVNPNFISAQGTSIGDAIDLANSSFSPDSKNPKTLIIISDGEDHEGNLEKHLERAKQLGIKIYTIGIGSSRGTPVYMNGVALRDKDNNVVISKLNETLLKQISSQTGGEYYNFSSRISILKHVYEKTSSLEQDGKIKVAKFDEKYHYFIFPAFFLLLFEFFILIRKNRWLAKINIFSN